MGRRRLSLRGAKAGKGEMFVPSFVLCDFNEHEFFLDSFDSVSLVLVLLDYAGMSLLALITLLLRVIDMVFEGLLRGVLRRRSNGRGGVVWSLAVKTIILWSGPAPARNWWVLVASWCLVTCLLI